MEGSGVLTLEDVPPYDVSNEVARHPSNARLEGEGEGRPEKREEAREDL